MKVVRRLSMVVAVLAVLGAGVLAGLGWSSGWRAYILRTGSMSPHVPTGDLVVDRPVHSISQVRVGEVITFAKVPGQLTTHRVAAITPLGIRTKGDANPTDDYGYVTASQLVGRVEVVVPFGGYVVEFFSHVTGVVGFLLALGALWVAWTLLRPKRGAHSRRDSGRATPAAVP